MRSNTADQEVRMSLNGSVAATAAVLKLVQQVFPDTQHTPEPSNTMVYIVHTAQTARATAIDFATSEDGEVTVTLDLGPDPDLTVEEGAPIPVLDDPSNKIDEEISAVYYVKDREVRDGPIPQLQLIVHPWKAYKAPAATSTPTPGDHLW